MHFLTFAEARAWSDGRVALGPRGTPVPPSDGPRYARVSASTDVAFSRQLERALQPRDECLLWVTESEVWRGTENLHLYYRLRQSYGDLRPLGDAPGHLFHAFEAADLVTFLQVGILSGWDMHLLPSEGYARAFVSHHEFVDFAADAENPALVDEFAAAAGARVITNTPAA